MSISGKLPQAGCNAIKKRLLLQTRLLCDVQNIGKNKKASAIADTRLAPPVGLEPTTLRLTAACSTTVSDLYQKVSNLHLILII